MKHKIILLAGDFGWDYIIAEVRKGGRDHLIQTDWDYPMAAELFGWRPRPGKNDHSRLIAAAGKYLDDHIGKVVVSEFFDYID